MKKKPKSLSDRAQASWKVRPLTHAKLTALSAKGHKLVLLAEVAADMVLSLSAAELAERVAKVVSR